MNKKEIEKEIERLENMLEINKENKNVYVTDLKLHWIKLKENLNRFLR